MPLHDKNVDSFPRPLPITDDDLSIIYNFFFLVLDFITSVLGCESQETIIFFIPWGNLDIVGCCCFFHYERLLMFVLFGWLVF